MTNSWPDPHHQRDHIPSMPDGLRPAGQWQNVNSPSPYHAFQGCSCSWCSITRHNGPPDPRILEHQGPWFPGNQAIPYANQYLGIAATVNDQTEPQFVSPPQADPQWNQENAGYAPPYEVGGPLRIQTNVGLDQTQVVGLSVPESLRRLAGCYVNNPESLVNAVRLEPGGASGRFQVVITVEITDILFPMAVSTS